MTLRPSGEIQENTYAAQYEQDTERKNGNGEPCQIGKTGNQYRSIDNEVGKRLRCIDKRPDIFRQACIKFGRTDTFELLIGSRQDLTNNFHPNSKRRFLP